MNLPRPNTGRPDSVENSAAPIAGGAELPSPADSAEAPLRLFVLGFNKMERQLLEGTVRLSQRRKPRLQLLREDEADTADLVMIDGRDADSVQWAESRSWLRNKPVIWIDSAKPRPEHFESKRPVQWPILPMLLARALEQSAASAVRDSAFAALPRSEPTPAQPTAQGASQPKRVLVVDDSLAVRSYLRALLEARGLQVVEADCVSKALAAVSESRFDCALMDVLMPDLDGYEGCKRLKSMKASIGRLPVVMLTSKSSPFDRIRGKMAGCDAYLTKPVNPAELHEVLAQQLGLVPIRPGGSHKTNTASPDAATAGLRASTAMRI